MGKIIGENVFVFSYFPFGFEGRVWDLIVSVPDHCLPFYFAPRKWDQITFKQLKHKKSAKINGNRPIV